MAEKNQTKVGKGGTALTKVCGKTTQKRGQKTQKAGRNTLAVGRESREVILRTKSSTRPQPFAKNG